MALALPCMRMRMQASAALAIRSFASSATAASAPPVEPKADGAPVVAASPPPTPTRKPPNQTFLGEVISTANQKTIKVRVERIKMHPIVLKEQCVVGDWVRINASIKRGERKNFELAEVVVPAARYTDADGKLHTQRAYTEEDMKKHHEEYMSQPQHKQPIPRILKKSFRR